MQYSPKLKTAMEEIKAVLKKHDIAGFVVLNDGAGFSEYLNAISPSYSCAKLSEDGIAFRLKASEVGKERAKEIADGTYNMITHFADMVGRHALMYIEAKELLKSHWGGEDGDSKHTSHDQQNN